VLAVILLIILIRWTIPRFRFDQLMGLTWKVFIPLSLANVVAVMTVKQFGWNVWCLLPMSIGLFVGAGIIGANASRLEILQRPRASVAPA
jgi:NADH-quinone oxidoreductase subunit H